MRFIRFIAASLVLAIGHFGCGSGDYITVTVTDVNPPPAEDDGLADDKLEDKQTSFDPELVDRRPLEDWLVNQSEAVIKLDVPLVRGDEEADLLTLRPTYADAMKAAAEKRSWMTMLPSVNLIDGKAKQFDDGLYAAIDQAYFVGVADAMPSHLDLIERLLAKVDPKSEAAAYLAAGLTLGGRETTAEDDARRLAFMQEFQASPALSKPIGFYTWNDTLKKCWAFLRYFQQPLEEDEAIVAELVQALEADTALAADCQTAAQFYGKLTNPLSRLTVGDLVGVDVSSQAALKKLRQGRGVTKTGVSLFPPSTSRENELFARLFPRGVPEGVNLMKEMVSAIRSGKVDLSPRKNSGWYDHQVYALETLLLPERGEEHQKLLLTKPYKKRMLEAFEALLTKRRETHLLHAEAAATVSTEGEQPDGLAPRLRLEPCPSYYLRTARSYTFLQAFLNDTIGEPTLKTLHGLRESSEQGLDLASELESQRRLFYGFYLVSCEDIGLKPALDDGEAGDEAERDECYMQAVAWLEKVADEPDLAWDTRVAVPIYIDPLKGTSRLWVTLGVRLTKLETSFAKAPRIKPAEGEGEWEQVEEWKLTPVEYLIAVDEFAEVEIPTLEPPNRKELRKLCLEYKTKEHILEALSAGKWRE